MAVNEELKAALLAAVPVDERFHDLTDRLAEAAERYVTALDCGTNLYVISKGFRNIIEGVRKLQKVNDLNEHVDQLLAINDFFNTWRTYRVGSLKSKEDGPTHVAYNRVIGCLLELEGLMKETDPLSGDGTDLSWLD